jgi:phage FluMu gp28-like protein
LNESTDYLEVNSKGHLKLKNNNCEIRALATSKDALRGFTPTFLVMDEAAFIDNGSEVFGAALASLGTGGKVSLISTPNGMDPLYYKTYDNARKKDNNFNIVEMKWFHDIRYNRGLYWKKEDEEDIKCETIGRKKLRWEYNDKIYETDESVIEYYNVMIDDGWKPLSPWYEEMAADMGDPKKIAQELDVSFIGSGGNVIDDEYITYHETNNVIEPEYYAEVEKSMWIWKKPEEGHKYIMGVDVSRGDGKDSSTIVILDFENLEQVAEFKFKLPPDILAEIVYKYGNLYNAYTVVDITGGMGVSTVLKLLEMDYKHLHYDDPKSRKLSEKYAKKVYKQGEQDYKWFLN